MPTSSVTVKLVSVCYRHLYYVQLFIKYFNLKCDFCYVFVSCLCHEFSLVMFAFSILHLALLSSVLFSVLFCIIVLLTCHTVSPVFSKHQVSLRSLLMDCYLGISSYKYWRNILTCPKFSFFLNFKIIYNMLTP